jgi:flagellar protein FlbD
VNSRRGNWRDYFRAFGKQQSSASELNCADYSSAVSRGSTRGEGNDVIQLTRLNHQQFAVNSDLIKFIDKAPDTVVTLTTGEKIVVLETPERVIEKVIEFRRALIAGLSSASINPQVASSLKHTNAEVHTSSETPSLG